MASLQPGFSIFKYFRILYTRRRWALSLAQHKAVSLRAIYVRWAGAVSANFRAKMSIFAFIIISGCSDNNYSNPSKVGPRLRNPLYLHTTARGDRSVECKQIIQIDVSINHVYSFIYSFIWYWCIARTSVQ